MTRSNRFVLAASWLAFTACGENDKKVEDCSFGVLEGDLEPDEFMGPGAGPDGKLSLDPNAQYVVSATYGRPRPGPDGAPVTQRYVDIFADIATTLQSTPGLVAFNLASSDACGSGRTIAVWRSEDEMYEFVASPAHIKAVTAVNELLLPGYAVTHYSARSAEQMTWAEGARQLAASEAD